MSGFHHLLTIVSVFVLVYSQTIESETTEEPIECNLCVDRFNWTNCDAAARSRPCSDALVISTHNFLELYNPGLVKTASSGTSGRQFRCFRLELEIDVSVVEVYIRGCTYDDTTFCEGWNANGANPINCATCSTGMCERNATWDVLPTTTTTVDPSTSTAVSTVSSTTQSVPLTTTPASITETPCIVSTTTPQKPSTTTPTSPAITTTSATAETTSTAIPNDRSTSTSTSTISTTTASPASSTNNDRSTTTSTSSASTSTRSPTTSTSPAITTTTAETTSTAIPSDRSTTTSTSTSSTTTSSPTSSTTNGQSTTTTTTTSPTPDPNALSCMECASAVSWEHCTNSSRLVQCTTAAVNELHSELLKFNSWLPVGDYSDFKCYSIQVNFTVSEHGGVQYGMGCTYASAGFCTRDNWHNATILECSGAGSVSAATVISLMMVAISTMVIRY